MNWLAIGLGTLAFFAVGALWYGPLFSKVWQREAGITERPQGPAIARAMGLTLLAEFVVVLALGHMFAFLQPGDHAKMMIATGFGLAIMAPAIGIGYVHQRKSLLLFAIDAGYFIVGMAVVGLVFVALG
ncbi:MAG: DUF1761 domain-containing protein [Croceibacterium sp.]